MSAQLKQLLFELGGNSWAHLVDDDDDLASLSDLGSCSCSLMFSHGSQSFDILYVLCTGNCSNKSNWDWRKLKVY